MVIVPPGSFNPPPPLDFRWDDAYCLEYVYFLPEVIHDRLSCLTHNANLALSIGMAKWIFARFKSFDDDPIADAFVDAAWAEMTADWHCSRYYPPDEEWQGPVRRPMVAAMTIIFDCIAGRGDNPFIADRSVWMLNLARHVIKPADAFESWFQATLLRLEATHTWEIEGNPEPDLFDDSFPQGNPVSPEVLSASEPYDPNMAPALLERFVQQERRKGNPFVLDSQEFLGDAED